jgi:hypothetical protein
MKLTWRTNIGISFRRKDRLTSEVIWSVLGKVAQSNTRFNAFDKLIMAVHSVKMPIGNGRGIPTKGRPLSTIGHLQKSIVEVKAENNCLAHAVVIAIAKLTNDSDYVAYRKGRKIRAAVNHSLMMTDIDLTDGGDIPELMKFQEHFKDYRIVFGELNCEDLVFDGQVESEKRIKLLYDDVTHHYHVINSVTSYVAKVFL